MRLIKPSPGELADRQSILELKIDYGLSEIHTQETVDRGKTRLRSLMRKVVSEPTKINIIPFKEELEAIIQYTTDKWVPGITDDENKVDEYDRLYEELSEVNGNLWKLEDQARILRAAPDKFEAAAAIRAAEVLFAINSQNDQRAELVRKINSLWGINHQEKLYS